MCRFLIVKSQTEIDPAQLLNQFAIACEKSTAPDGERQGDGFGVAFKKGNKWQVKKSISPIWEGKELFKETPKTKLFMAHARSASFSKGKDNLEYNQPFVDGDLAFVFNGTIKKMKTALKLDGEIGSQKLFSLVKFFLKQNPNTNILGKVRDFVLAKSESIEGMNIGLINEDEVSILCQYSNTPDYFTLRYFENKDILIISSEKFGEFKWDDMGNGEVISFS